MQREAVAGGKEEQGDRGGREEGRGILKGRKCGSGREAGEGEEGGVDVGGVGRGLEMSEVRRTERWSGAGFEKLG